MTLTCLNKAQAKEVKKIRIVNWFNFYIIDHLQHKDSYKYVYCRSGRNIVFEFDYKMNLHIIYVGKDKLVEKERVITKRGKIYDK